MKQTRKKANTLSNGGLRRAIVMMLLCDLLADQIGSADTRLSSAAGKYTDFIYSYLTPDTKHQLHEGTAALEQLKPTSVFLVWAVIKVADLSESQNEWAMYSEVRQAAQLHAQNWLPMPPPEQDMQFFISALFGTVPDGAVYTKSRKG